MSESANTPRHPVGRRQTGPRPRRASRYPGLATPLIIALQAAGLAYAAGPTTLPTGGTIGMGQGSIKQSGSKMTIDQGSDRLSINWTTFNIGADATVQFVQPSSSSVALNRVAADAGASRIEGRLTANGQVFLLNPSGVLFGTGAQVNVGGLVASSLSVSDGDFAVGRYKLTGSSSGGAVVNRGTLSASDGGYIVLAGPQVRNEGVVVANKGTVALAAGTAMTLDFQGDRLISLAVDAGAVNALVENRQLVQADGGTVVMTAKAADMLSASVVNNSGVVQARTVENRDGVIRLLADPEGGAVNLTGTLDASAPTSGNGGRIETSAGRVNVSDSAVVTTSAAAGKTGQWLIDPPDFTIAASGGDITGATLARELAGSNVTIRSSSGSKGQTGDINVNDAVSWNSPNSLELSAYHSVNVNAPIANAGSGGVLLRSDNTGACVTFSTACGTVNFPLAPAGGPVGSVSVNGGNLDIYYNPVGSAGSQGPNGVGPDYSSAAPSANSPTYDALIKLGAINLNGGSRLNAWMLVNDAQQLQAMTTNLAGKYALGKDIDASATATWNEGAGFQPVGGSVIPGSGIVADFTGAFDGQGHAISNLTINRSTNSDVGLFGSTSASVTIRNVALNAVSVSGGTDVGGLVGLNSGTISNAHVDGSVSGQAWVGGLAGENLGSVATSYSQAQVTGTDFSVGGLIGYNAGSVDRAYSNGTVDVQGVASSEVSPSGIGGLIGSNDGRISNAYSTSAVSASAGSSGVGGLVGINTGTVATSFASGQVSVPGATANVGGLVGVAAIGNLNGGAPGSATNSYWDAAATGQSTSAGGTALNSGSGGSPFAQGSYTGFDFAGTWWMPAVDGNTRPFLRMEYGTDIGNAHQLQLVALDPKAAYRLLNDIDMSELGNASGMWNTQTGFVPIGSSATPFTGSVDGQSHTIVGLIENRPTESGVGLFGSLGTGAAVHDLGLAAATITGAGDVGALAGLNAGTVTNVDTDGQSSVVGLGQVGGLVGFNSGTIQHSSAAGSVTSRSGGAGNVTVGFSLGGLVGTNTGTIRDSLATARVTAAGDVGGLVGDNQGALQNSHYDIDTVAINGGAAVTAGGVYDAQYQDWIKNGRSLSVSNYSASLPLDAASGYYLVGSVQSLKDLLGFSDVASLKFRLSSNLDLSAAPGLYIPYFSAAELDGAGHTVSNLSGPTVIPPPSTVVLLASQPLLVDGAGFIGLLASGSTVRNIGIASGSVSGAGYVGGLVGYNRGTLVDVFSKASVDGISQVGGLVGYNAGSITNAFAAGPVAINPAYAATSSSGDLGGLVGTNAAGASIANVYSTGVIAGNYGGLVGTNAGSVAGGYWDTQLSGQSASAAGTPLTTAQMQTGASFAAFDFVNTWRIYDGHTDPLLKVFLAPVTVTANDLTKPFDGTAFSGGNGITLSAPNANLSGAVAYSGTSQGALHAGSYTISAGGLYSQDYDITYAPGRLTIVPAALPVTVANLTRLYGDANPTTETVTGPGGSFLISVTSPLSLTAHAGTTAPLKFGGLLSVPAGSNAFATDYQPVPADATSTLSVTPRPLTLQVDNQSRNLNSANPATGTASVVDGTFAFGDGVNPIGVTSTLPSTAAIGASAALANSGTIALRGGTNASLATDYAFTFLPGTLTVAGAANQTGNTGGGGFTQPGKTQPTQVLPPIPTGTGTGSGPPLVVAVNPTGDVLAHAPEQYLGTVQQRHDSLTDTLQVAIDVLRGDPDAADLPPCPDATQDKRAVQQDLCMPTQADLDGLRVEHAAETSSTQAAQAAAPGATATAGPGRTQSVTSTEGTKLIQRKVAYLIGNNDYPNNIGGLDTPVGDVTAVAEELRTKFGYEVNVLRNATRLDTVRALKQASIETTPDDSVLIFYAGHGYRLDDTKLGYWLPVDANEKDPQTWISNTDITRFLSLIPARQIILVSDSCYSGTLAKEQAITAGKSLARNDILSRRSVVVMTSGGEEPVSDAGKEGHSIFVYSLMDTLKRAAASEVGVNLYGNVREIVEAEYPQSPQYGASATARHEAGGDYLFEQLATAKPQGK